MSNLSASWKLYDVDADPDATNANFLIGPVVGRVTESTARILVESAHDATVHAEAHLISGDGARAAPSPSLFAGGVFLSASDVAVAAKAPTVFQVNQLMPDTRYIVAVTLNGETRLASFRTPCDKAQWKICVVSCNSHKFLSDPGHWERLEGIAHTLDAIIHCGDQIYGDDDVRRAAAEDETVAEAELPDVHRSAWVRSRDLVRGLPHALWENHRDIILEHYRAIYRRTWNYPALAAVLASVPNYMICDDHEVCEKNFVCCFCKMGKICDDIGDLPQHSDPNHAEYFVATCAYQTYQEYQAQLNKDVDVMSLDPAYTFFKLSPRVAVVMTDNRIERSLRRPLQLHKDWTNRQFLGPSQWEALESALATELESTDLLFFVTPTPLIFLSHAATDTAIKVIDDAVGTWGNRAYDREQVRLLRRLSDWQGEKVTRGVCILAGDIHVGGFSSALMHEKGSIVNQITASAICNEPTTHIGSMTAVVARAVLRLDTYMQDFTVKHREWVFDPNFGLVDALLETDRPPHVTGSLYHARGHAHIRNFKFGEPLTQSDGKLRASAAAEGEGKGDDIEAAQKPAPVALVQQPSSAPREEPHSHDRHANMAAEAAYATAAVLGEKVHHARGIPCKCVVA